MSMSFKWSALISRDFSFLGGCHNPNSQTCFRSATSIFITVPFVLSESPLNALACKCTVLASNGGLGGRTLIERKYSLEKTVPQFLSLIEKALTANRTRASAV